jgi:hypothetical protein
MHVKREACERTKPTCAADISKKQIFTGIYTKIYRKIYTVVIK